MSRLVKKPDSSGPHSKPSAVPQEGAPRNPANISGNGSLPAARASLETLREQVQRLEALTLPENMDSRSDQLVAQAATLAIAAQQQATHALLSGAVEANIRAHQRPSPPPPRSSLSQQDNGSSSTGPPSSFVRRQSMASSLNNNHPTITTTSTKGPAGEAVGGVTPPRPSPGHRVVATSTSSSSTMHHHLQPTTPPPRTHHGANTTTTVTSSSSSSAKWLAAVMQDGWSADEAVAGLAATGEVSARAAIAWLNEHRRAGGDGRGLPSEPATLSSSSSSATTTAPGASGSTASSGSSSANHHARTTTTSRPLPASVAGVAAGAGVRAVRATTPPVDLSSTNHGTPPDRSQPQQHPPNSTPCRLQVRDPKGKVHSLEPLTPNNPFLGSTTLYEAVHAFYARQQSQPQPTKQSTASSAAVVGNNAVVPTGVVVVVPWKQERYAVAAMRKVTLDDAGMCPSGTITLMF